MVAYAKKKKKDMANKNTIIHVPTFLPFFSEKTFNAKCEMPKNTIEPHLV